MTEETNSTPWMKRMMREMGRKGGFAAARNMTKKQRVARAKKGRRAQLKQQRAAKKGGR